MNEFYVLIGQIFLIALLQLIAEVLIDAKNRPLQATLINVACFLGGLYLVMDFLFGRVWNSLSTMIQFR